MYRNKPNKYDMERMRVEITNLYTSDVVKIDAVRHAALDTIVGYLKEYQESPSAEVIGNAWYDRAIRQTVPWSTLYHGSRHTSLRHHTIKFINV